VLREKIPKENIFNTK